MKEQHIAQALICDEFGSCEGVITLRDISGGLVGAVEQTKEQMGVVVCQDGESWLADGQCPMHNFLLYFG